MDRSSNRLIEMNAVIRVGDGRGFVVGQQRVITAAHCLPKLPPAHPFSYTEERTYAKLLGPLDSKPTVWAECLFADPVADIAVLGSPDEQELSNEAEAYQQLLAKLTPLRISDAPKQGVEELKLSPGKFGGTIKRKTPGQGSAEVLSLAGQWMACAISRRGQCLRVETEDLIVAGMSGSPIVAAGRAIGLVSTGRLNPVLKDCLPGWFFRRYLRIGLRAFRPT